MNSILTRFIKMSALVAVVFLGVISFAPSMAFAAVAPTVTPVNLVSSNASTTLAKVGDVVTLTFTTSTTTLVSPTVSIFAHATTTAIETVTDATNSKYTWAASTTMVSNDTDGNVSLFATVGNSDGSATTSVSATTDGSAVRFDNTPPTLNSVTWNDVDGSTNISGTDTLALIFSETMATTTISSSNLDTALSLSNSHTFGTTSNGLATSWNVAGTVLTITLGSDTTVVSGDTVDPAASVTDAAGNADANVSALTIADNLAPKAPTGLSSYVFHSYVLVPLVSFGSSQIRYTTDGSSPTCTTGSVYVSEIKISNITTLKAVGCDAAGNSSAIITAQYNPYFGNSLVTTQQAAVTTPVKTVAPAKVVVSSKAHVAKKTAKAVVKTNPSGLLESQVQAIVSLLKTFGNIDNSTINNVLLSLRGEVSSTPAAKNASYTNKNAPLFVKNMHIGSVGVAALNLQKYLNSHGFIVSATGPGSVGNETEMFGSKTRKALIRYQVARGITPSVGYFGPKTRAEVNLGK